MKIELRDEIRAAIVKAARKAKIATPELWLQMMLGKACCLKKGVKLKLPKVRQVNESSDESDPVKRIGRALSQLRAGEYSAQQLEGLFDTGGIAMSRILHRLAEQPTEACKRKITRIKRPSGKFWIFHE